MFSFLAPNSLVLNLDSRFQRLSFFSLSLCSAVPLQYFLSFCTSSAHPSLSSGAHGGQLPSPVEATTDGPLDSPRIPSPSPLCCRQHPCISASILRLFSHLLMWDRQQGVGVGALGRLRPSRWCHLWDQVPRWLPCGCPGSWKAV